MLKLQEFIKDNPYNFGSLLSQKPYAIKIQEDEHFMLFKYNQIDSDFTNELVRECRGIILDKADWSVACHPFHKFGNYGESYVPDIDWESASVQEKLDGSLIKCWYNRYEGDWQWSTNGTINANTADLAENIVGIKTFGELVLHTLKVMGTPCLADDFDIPFTYLFELCTPLNRVVVPHPKYKLYHLVTKHNLTGAEDVDYIGLDVPRKYNLDTLEDCVEAAADLYFTDEGYVVVDRMLNRVKIKSPAYLAVHHLKGEGSIVPRRALDLIRANEHNELLGYFPEYKEYFDEMADKFHAFVLQLSGDMIEARLKMETLETRKEFAMWAKDQKMPSVMFAVYDHKFETAIESLAGMPSEKLIKYL